MIGSDTPIKTFYIATSFYAFSFFLSFFEKRISNIFLSIGLFINLASEAIGRYLTWPFCNMFSEPYFLPIIFSSYYLLKISLKIREDRIMKGFILISSLIPSFFSEGYYPPYTLMSKSIYAHIFHLFLFIAHGLLFLSAYRATFLKEDAYSLATYGFFSLCIAGLFGMIWSYVGRGDIISWNYFYFENIAIWFYYLAFFHLRPKKVSFYLFIGALLIFFFDYLPQVGGINSMGILYERLHGLYQ